VRSRFALQLKFHFAYYSLLITKQYIFDMSPLKLLIIIFIAVPIIEIFLLIKVGSIIGAIPTILMIIITAVIGAYLLKAQGISTINRVQSSLQKGEIPAIEMMEGLVLLICGALLLTPGFFTDALGFLALIPPIRTAFVVWALKHSNVMQTMGTPQQPFHEGEFHRQHSEKHEHIVIDGEYKKEDK